MKTIGFDIDGVLYPWRTAVSTYLKAFCGIDADSDDMWKNIEEHVSKELIHNLCQMPDICSKCVPSKEMLDILWKLSDKYTIFYITARPNEVKTATETYFRKYGFPQNNNLIFTRDKPLYVKLLEVDLFVEDQLYHADKLKDITNLILMRQPWNERAWNEHTTIGNLHELFGLISMLEEKSKVK